MRKCERGLKMKYIFLIEYFDETHNHTFLIGDKCNVKLIDDAESVVYYNKKQNYLNNSQKESWVFDVNSKNGLHYGKKV